MINSFGRYLKRNTTVQTGPRFEWLADDAMRSAANPLPRRETARGDRPTLPIVRSPSGTLIAATVAANAGERGAAARRRAAPAT